MENTGAREECRSELDLSKNVHSADASLDSKIWSGLSDELVELVRTFLPPSALFRFRCVCKQWNLLHSDPGFLKLYNEIAAPSTSNVLVFTHDAEKKRAQAFYLESYSKWFQLPLEFLPEEACVPLAEAGGLLCLGALQKGNKNLWVCNPLTQSWRKLPDCHLRALCREGHRPLVNMIVKAKAAYKVVVVGDPSITHTLLTLVTVYDSTEGVWTHYADKLSIRDNLPSTSVLRDGVLYWCTMSPDGLHSYDLERGVWNHQTIHFPRLFTPFGDAHLFRIGNHIGLIGLKLGGQSFSIGMWTLAEEGDSARAGPQWVEMPWRSLPVRRQSHIQSFVQKNVVCLASLDSQTWIRCNLTKGTWHSGIPVPGHGEEPQVHYNWCPYEPRLDIPC